MRVFVRDARALNYKPSQIAASALILSLNICDSQHAQIMGLRQIEGLAQRCHYFEKSSGLASPIKVGRLRAGSYRNVFESKSAQVSGTD